jgi:hypothetical protein
MQYTKPMIDLVYEIRRRVDSDMKPSVKMANPEILQELADYHHHTKDTITKTLIKELLFLAGDQWQLLLEPASQANEKMPDIPKQVVKMYRGQTTLLDAPHSASTLRSATTKLAEANASSHSELLINEKTTVPPKPVRMYRGQPVY